ncbi:hypothetical protein H9P43_000285 [Blastocladiella emersonii ATCC 22665]|nr:hypothetical protein H9P43_000285 [Blastocladiella emersonii ATCC 22665]
MANPSKKQTPAAAAAAVSTAPAPAHACSSNQRSAARKPAIKDVVTAVPEVPLLPAESDEDANEGADKDNGHPLLLPLPTIVKPNKRKANLGAEKAVFDTASTNFLLEYIDGLARQNVLGNGNALKSQHQLAIAQALSPQLQEQLEPGRKTFQFYKWSDKIWSKATATGKYSRLNAEGSNAEEVGKEVSEDKDDAAHASKRSRTSNSSSRRLSDSDFLMGIQKVFKSVLAAESKPVLAAAIEWAQGAYGNDEDFQIQVATRLTKDQALRIMAVAESMRKRVLELFIQ